MSLRVMSNVDSIPSRPRVPSDAARRMIFSYQGGLLAIWWIGIIFTGVGTLMSVMFLWGLPVDLAIAFTGKEVQAIPIESVERTDVKVKINNVRREMFEITYTYQVDGVSYTNTSSTISHASISAAVKQEPFIVEVASFNPSWSRIKGSTHNFFGYIPIFVLLFPLLGLTFWGVASIKLRRRRQTFMNGAPAVAKIVSAGLDRTVRINRRSPYKIGWSFVVNGAQYHGSLSSLDGLEGITADQDAVVLYDPQNPAINTIYLE
jgi:hypothetical protein